MSMTTIPTKPQDLKAGMKFLFQETGFLATVTSVDAVGVAFDVSNAFIGLTLPSALHHDVLNKMFPQGVPVIFEPNVIEGTVTIPKPGEAPLMTIGQVTSLLMDAVCVEGRAKVGDTYRVRWEQLPGVSK